MTGVSRRNSLATGALAAGALAFGPSFWRAALAAESVRYTVQSRARDGATELVNRRVQVAGPRRRA